MRETNYLKSNEKVLRILREIDKFSPFSSEDILSFLDLGKLLEYGQDEEIITAGDQANYLFFLIAGEVGIMEGDKAVKTLRRTGELFGEMSIIDGSPRSASVRALSKTLALRLDCSVMGYVEGDKELALGYTVYRLFCEVLAERLRVTTEENIALKLELAEQTSV